MAAPAAELSRTLPNVTDGSRVMKNLAPPEPQCRPMSKPNVGTRILLRGNGTTVGTVLSLQCPSKHKLVGGELTCVMGNNSTEWVGHNLCKPLSTAYGFRVALLASIVSSGIIMLMSVAFLTCCLLDCIKADEKKRQRRDPELHWEESEQNQQDIRSRNSHISRNNNNNNSKKTPCLWDPADSAMRETLQPCRCQQQQQHSPCLPACTYAAPPPTLSALPGRDYDQPLLAQTMTCPPEYPGPPLSSSQTASSGLLHVSAAGSGLVWQYAAKQNSFSEANTSITRSLDSNVNPREVSIRIISV